MCLLTTTFAAVALLFSAGSAIYKSHIQRPMRSNRHTIITISRALLALGFGVLASNHALAQDCTAVSGSTVIITTNCSDLILEAMALM